VQRSLIAEESEFGFPNGHWPRGVHVRGRPVFAKPVRGCVVGGIVGAILGGWGADEGADAAADRLWGPDNDG
jgi:hypothetical protein